MREKLTEEERKRRRAERVRAYYERNKQRINQRGVERRKKKREADPSIRELERGYTRKYRSKNREELNDRARESMRAYRSTPEGAEANREACKRYRASHRDELLVKQRAKHHANRDENNASRSNRYHATKETSLPKWREKRQQTRITSPTQFLLKGAKERSKRRGLPFDLSKEYLDTLWTGRCAVSGLPFELGKRGFGPKFLSPSLDRIVPALGYTQGNVRIVLWGVNAFKYDGSDEDMYRVAVAIVRNFRPAPSPSR